MPRTINSLGLGHPIGATVFVLRMDQRLGIQFHFNIVFITVLDHLCGRRVHFVLQLRGHFFRCFLLVLQQYVKFPTRCGICVQCTICRQLFHSTLPTTLPYRHSPVSPPTRPPSFQEYCHRQIRFLYAKWQASYPSIPFSRRTASLGPFLPFFFAGSVVMNQIDST